MKILCLSDLHLKQQALVDAIDHERLGLFLMCFSYSTGRRLLPSGEKGEISGRERRQTEKNPVCSSV